MNDILTRTIIISGVEKKNSSNNKLMIKFKDEKGLSYTMWPQKQDGTESAAYFFFKVMPNDGVGRAVEISYTEQQGDFQGKPITYKTIIGMKASHEGTSQVVAKKMIGTESQDKEQEKWDKINKDKSDDIRANVALKMVSEIIASGQIGLDEWELWTNRFYNYQPSEIQNG